MNQKFNKALYLLDMGKYDRAIELLKTAFDEVNNIYEKLEIKACTMEVYYELEDFEKTKECIKFIIDNATEDNGSNARETALEIANEIGYNI